MEMIIAIVICWTFFAMLALLFARGASVVSNDQED
jgi:hypothetical protein